MTAWHFFLALLIFEAGWLLGRWFERRKYVLSFNALKHYAQQYNIEPRPGETAEHLRERLLRFVRGER